MSTRHLMVTTLLLLLSVCALVSAFACSHEQAINDPLKNAQTATNQPTNQPSTAGAVMRTPGEAVVVVHDIESYTEDCGCSGSARGGLARIAQLRSLAEAVNIVFAGRVFFTQDQMDAFLGEPFDASPESLRQYAFQFTSTVQAIRAIGNAWIVVTGREAEALAKLARLGIDISAFDELQQDGSSIGFGTTTIQVHERGVELENGVVHVLPTNGSRARRVMVCALWPAPLSKTWIYEPKLDFLVPLSPASDLARQRADTLLNDLLGSGKSVVAVYELEINAGIPEDSAMRSMLDSVGVGVMHTGPPIDFGQRGIPRATEQHFYGCKSCHESAYKSWVGSQHASAMSSLALKGKDADKRCTPCHTSRSDAGLYIQAVTCYSCHNSSTTPAEACIACHTPLTDPMGRYKAHLKNICDGRADATGTRCNR